MKKLIPLSVMATMAIIGAAYGQSAPSQSGQSTPAAQSKGASPEGSQSRAPERAGNRTESKGNARPGRDVNVNIRTHTRPDTVVRRRGQRITVTEDRSPSVTVVKKKKKFVKRKWAHIVAVPPPSRTTIVRMRRGVAVGGPTVRTRTTIRSSVRQQPSVNVNVRSRTQTRTEQSRTTTGSGRQSQGDGQTQKSAPAQGGSGQGQGGSATR